MDSLILGLRVLVSLGAVLGLIWFLHRRLRRGAVAGRGRAMTVVSRQGVGQKASVVLLDTEGKRFLLGVTEHGINVLHTADAPAPEPATVAAGAGNGATGTTATGFDRELQKQLNRTTLAPSDGGALSGSILDSGTWKQAFAAVRGGPRP